MPRETTTTDPTRAPGVVAAMRNRFGLGNSRSMLALLDQVAVSGTSLVTTIIVGRFCGSDALGLFTLAISAVILTKGMNESLVTTPFTVFRSRLGDRLTPEAHAGGALVGAAFLATMLTSAALLTATAFALSSQPWPVKALTWALVVAIPLTLAREFARRFDMARLNTWSAFLVDFSITVIQISLLVLLAVQAQLTSATAILCIAAACGFVVAVWLTRRRELFTIQRDQLAASIKHDWTFGRWLLVDHLICFAQLYAMHWLLTLMMGTSATGILAACAAIASLAVPLLLGIGNYLSPRFAEIVSQGSRRQTMRLYWRTTIVLGIGVTLFAVIAAMFGSELLWLLYDDPAYAGYGFVVGLLAFRLMFAIPTIAADHAVVAMEGPRGIVAATLAGLISTFGLGIPLIHFYGVTGAAIAMFIGNGVESAVLIAVFNRNLQNWKWQDEG